MGAHPNITFVVHAISQFVEAPTFVWICSYHLWEDDHITSMDL